MKRRKPVIKRILLNRKGGACDFKDIASSFRKVRRNLRGPLKVRSLVEQGRRP